MRLELTITHVPAGWVPTETGDVTLSDLEASQPGDPQTGQQGVFQQTGLFRRTDRTTREDQRARVVLGATSAQLFTEDPVCPVWWVRALLMDGGQVSARHGTGRKP